MFGHEIPMKCRLFGGEVLRFWPHSDRLRKYLRQSIRVRALFHKPTVFQLAMTVEVFTDIAACFRFQSPRSAIFYLYFYFYLYLVLYLYLYIDWV